MTTTAAILGILAALIPFGIFLWRRRIARDDSPEARRNEIDSALAKHDAAKVNEILGDAIRNTTPRN